VKIETTSSRNDETQRVRKSGAVDVGVIGYGYGSKRRWRPTMIQATWQRFRVNGDPWTDWTVEHVSWSGFNAKNDGTNGAPRSDRLWVSSMRDDESDAAVIEVVRAWIRAETPTGGLPDPIDERPVVVG
jgi:hypothetical protein